MTTFIFVMSPEATTAQQTRTMSELEERFPQHDFLLADDHFAEAEPLQGVDIAALYLAIPAGLEPATRGVEIRYSIQLSYGTDAPS